MPKCPQTPAPGPIRVLPALLGLALLSGCGPAAIGFGLSSAGGGGGGNAPATVAGLALLDAKSATSRIRCTVNDVEGDSVAVSLAFVLAGGAERPMTAVDSNPVTVAASPAGTAFEVGWNHAAEPEIGAGLVRGVEVVARVVGGGEVRASVDLGNDVPVARVVDPQGGAELDGIARLRVAVQDANDRCDVRVEFRELPDGDWQLARRAGSDAVEDFGIRAVDGRDGEAFADFFWDTDSDLPLLQRDVELRFTPREEDGVTTGDPAVSAPFTVDNNAAPAVELDQGAFFLNPDTTRGLPLPFRVTDREGDAVRVVFQWRSGADPDFVPLDVTDPAALDVALRDPAYRRDKRICTAFPRFLDGRLGSVGGVAAVLPELRAGRAALAPERVPVGGRLEVLRPFAAPERLELRIGDGPLQSPAAVLAAGDGLRALVLENRGSLTDLVELSLEDNSLVRRVASDLPGAPSALSRGATDRAVLVATDDAGTWRLFEVDTVAGTAAERIAFGAGGATAPQGPLRGVLARGAATVLATAGGALWRLDWSDPTQPSIVRVVAGLAVPWGITADPTTPGRVLVAERNAAVSGGSGRVVSVDPATGRIDALVARTAGGSANAFPAVTALALDAGGDRLLALCASTTSANRELVGLDLGRDDPVFSLGEVGSGALDVASGPDDLLLVPLPGVGDLAVGGGVEQRRTVVSWDTATATVTVDAPFASITRPGQRWRLAAPDPAFVDLRASATGAFGRFVWDTRDVPRGDVAVRAICADREIGADSRAATPRGVRNPRFLRQPLSGASTVLGIARGDFDGDGDMDFVATSAGTLEPLVAYLQGDDGAFTAQPLPFGSLGFVSNVAAGDLDGDGDQDLVVARGSDATVILLQTAPATFTQQPGSLAAPGYVRSVLTADLDQDGDVDIVIGENGRLVVYLQTAPLAFTANGQSLVTGGQTSDFKAADVDRDGDLDLVVAETFGDTVGLFRQTSTGRFTREAIVLDSGSRPDSVAIGDLDGDDGPEIAVANRGTGLVTLLAADAAGVFRPRPQSLVAGGAARHVEIADLDGDGRSDLLCANFGAGTVSIYMQQDGRLLRTPELVVPPSPNVVRVADFTGDGRADLVVGSGFLGLQGLTGSLAFFAQDGLDDDAISSFPAGAGCRDVAIVDIDQDGDEDLVTADRDADSLTILRQNLPGRFTAESVAAGPGTAMSAVAAGDVDGDGDVDLVGAAAGTDELLIWLGQPDRTFVRQSVPLAAGSAPVDVVLADFDRDGLLDIAAANSGQDRVAIVRQQSPGVFVAGPLLTTADEPWALAAADLDGDGDLDLVCGNRSSGQVSVFLQNAGGSFAPIGSPPNAGAGSEGVALLDVDGDGLLDIATANPQANRVSLFRQVSVGTFAARDDLVPGDLPFDIAAGDVDGDGRADLVTAGGQGKSSDRCRVLALQGGGRFLPRRPRPAGSGARAIAVGDVDGDGDGDIVVASLNASQVQIYWGGR